MLRMALSGFLGSGLQMAWSVNSHTGRSRITSVSAAKKFAYLINFGITQEIVGPPGSVACQDETADCPAYQLRTVRLPFSGFR
jgi:hypothetical protein